MEQTNEFPVIIGENSAALTKKEVLHWVLMQKQSTINISRGDPTKHTPNSTNKLIFIHCVSVGVGV